MPLQKLFPAAPEPSLVVVLVHLQFLLEKVFSFLKDLSLLPQPSAGCLAESPAVRRRQLVHLRRNGR